MPLLTAKAVLLRSVVFCVMKEIRSHLFRHVLRPPRAGCVPHISECCARPRMQLHPELKSTNNCPWNGCVSVGTAGSSLEWYRMELFTYSVMRSLVHSASLYWMSALQVGLWNSQCVSGFWSAPRTAVTAVGACYWFCLSSNVCIPKQIFENHKRIISFKCWEKIKRTWIFFFKWSTEVLLVNVIASASVAEKNNQPVVPVPAASLVLCHEAHCPPTSLP